MLKRGANESCHLQRCCQGRRRESASEARVARHSISRETNLVVMGLDDAKDETEDGTRGKVGVQILQKGMRLVSSGHGEVQQR